jgi:signal transduction histidine kinase
MRKAYLPSYETVAGRTFEEFCEERVLTHARTVAYVVLAVAIVWWPTDLVIFSRLPDAIASYARWRVGVAAMCVGYLVVSRYEWSRPYRRAMIFGLLTLGCAVVGYSQVSIGGPEQPWFHLMYIIPALTLVLPVRFTTRAIATTAISLAAAGAYLLPNPAYLSSPFVPLIVSFLSCTTVLSIGFGHSIQVLLRANFEQARMLDARVSERTIELQRLLHALETAREDERRRVGQDLHDELGQELTALRFALGYTRTRYEREPEAMAKNLEELDRLLDRTGAATRNLINTMRPKVLDELGLAAAAEWLVDGTAARTGISCRLVIDPTSVEALSHDNSTAAFRILQESLTNAVRHAEPDEITVHLEVANGAVELRVEDDGRGLDSSAKAGFGLSGMRERAEARGGSLTVAPRAPRGTVVSARLPLETE